MTRKSLPRAVLLVWALFLTRAAFYCVMMPLWEGWDEYGHFAWLDHWIAHGTLPQFHDSMAREIEESLRLAPLSNELRWIGPPHLSHEEWWALPDTQRADRMKQLRELPVDFAQENSAVKAQFYEAQQPPLYYWIASVPLRLASRSPLLSRVLLVRLFSAFLASFAIPFTWLAAKRNGLVAAALLAVAPGFVIDTFRIANDGLAIALFALTLWLLSRSNTRWWQVGIAIGLALLTKAYMLVLIPVLLLSWRNRKRELVPALSIALIVGGWWYARNLLLGNSLTGWLEHATAAQLMRSAFAIRWPGAVDIMAKSFTWFGGWSFLTLKSWMYQIIETLGAAAILTGLYKRRSASAIAAIASACFATAMLYGMLVYNVSHPGAILPGWYFWPAGAALAILVAHGSRWLSFTLVGLLAAIDLYGAGAVMIPYYSGLIARNRADASVIFQALARLHVPLAFAFCWAAATLAIPCIACIKLGAQND